MVKVVSGEIDEHRGGLRIRAQQQIFIKAAFTKFEPGEVFVYRGRFKGWQVRGELLEWNGRTFHQWDVENGNDRLDALKTAQVISQPLQTGQYLRGEQLVFRSICQNEKLALSVA